MAVPDLRQSGSLKPTRLTTPRVRVSSIGSAVRPRVRIWPSVRRNLEDATLTSPDSGGEDPGLSDTSLSSGDSNATLGDDGHALTRPKPRG
jgi:hypothetical protein